MNVPLIVVDGVSGAGKGTLASGLAEAFSMTHWDSGAMYRAIGLVAEDTKQEPIAVARCYTDLMTHPDLRTDRGGRLAAQVAAIPEVRQAVNKYVEKVTSELPGCVIDGRSGAWEYPDATIKIFLTASLEERAHRRCGLLQKTTIKPVVYEEVLYNLRLRDEADASREVFPLKEHPEAFKVDNTELQIHETFVRVVRICVRKLFLR